MRLRKVSQLLFCVLLELTAVSLAAQQASPNPAAPSATGTATVHVTVTDRKHHPLTGLKLEDFALTEDGQPQPIATVTADAPACIGLIVDHSGSMRSKLPTVDTALGNFVHAGNPEDRIFVVNFNDDPYLDQDFTRDLKLIEDALEFRAARGGTALYDAVAGAASHLAQARECKRNILVIVSDGDDNESRLKLDQLKLEVEKDGNPVIYALALPESNRSLADRAHHALVALTDATGGEAFFVKNASDPRQEALRLAEEVRSQYSVSYIPARPTVSGAPKLKVQVRLPRVKDPVVRANVPTPVDLSSAAQPATPAAQPAAPSPVRSQLPRTGSPELTNCIAGSVVDEHQKPVIGISVQAWPAFSTDSYASVPYPTTVTDEHGKFTITKLEQGSYLLFTANPSAGYPATKNQLYRTQPVDMAQASNHCGGTQVRVGPKAAKLKINAVDANTRNPVEHFGISVADEAHASVVVPEAEPEQEVLVPAGADLVVSVWSRGYFRSQPVAVKAPASEVSQEVTILLEPRN
jgi:Ca-activated chloride channel homolog